MNQGNDAFAPAPPVPDESSVDLSGLDAEYEQAKAANMEEIPDGKYQAAIRGVRLGKTQNDNPMLQYDMVILSGAHEGRHIHKTSVFTAASLPFFKAEMKILGIQLAKLSDLPNHLGAMLDLTLEVTKKTKGEYSNTYINKLLKVPPGGTAPDGPIPF